jgi:hypothetical protein
MFLKQLVQDKRSFHTKQGSNNDWQIVVLNMEKEQLKTLQSPTNLKLYT